MFSMKFEKCWYKIRFLKRDREKFENYLPASIHLVLLKVYERCMYDQMYVYLNKIYTALMAVWFL